MQFRSFETALGRALIRSPARLKLGRRRYGVEEAGAVADMIRPELVKDFPSASSNDIRYGLQALLLKYPALSDWHRALLAAEDIELLWRDGQPRVPSGSILPWLQLSNSFDEDTLIAHDFAFNHSLGGKAVEFVLPNWRTVARAGDRDLDVLLSQGVTDLHIHVGGVRMPQVAWMKLMSREGAHRAFSSLATKYEKRDQPSDGFSDHPRRGFAERIAKARDARIRLLNKVGLRASGSDRPHPGGVEQVWHHWKLSLERDLLIRCWSAIKRGSSSA